MTGLTGVDFDADLSGALLAGKDLSGAYLFRANLFAADLPGVNFSGANLSGAYLSRANLSGANFSGANLSNVDLSGRDLSSIHLSGANLSGANLSLANLSYVDLSRVNLSGAQLSGANLQSCQLVQCNLTGATLTGAQLYGTARDDWIIQDVRCTYVFWDAEGKIRSPKDRDLAVGEFERLYQALPTIEYVFQNGMNPLDPLIMDGVVQVIREQNPEYDIQIDSISAKGLAPSIKFTVRHEEQKEPALVEVTRRYDSFIEQLEIDKDRLAKLLAQSLENNRLQTFLLTGAVERIGDNIHAEPGANVATRGARINVEQHIHHAVELQKIIAEQPENSEAFRKVAKRKVMDVIGGAIQDFAKGKVREAAAEIVSICTDLGPVIAAYGFFKGLGT